MRRIIRFSLVQKIFVTLGVVIAIAYLTSCLFLGLEQRNLIFRPSPTLTKTPDTLNLPYEDIWLKVPAKNKTDTIHGWWIPAPSFSEGSNPLPSSDLVLLYLHGSGGNMGTKLGEMHRYHQMGFNVVSLDYRGYGRSKGDFPSEAQIYEDIDILWDYLIGDRRINPRNIFVMGHSLGGAIAIELAMRHPEFAALIVQNSFTSIREVINNKGKYKLFPVNLLLNQRFDSISKVPKLKMPVLFIQGTNDDLIPISMVKKLFELAPEPKELFIVPGAAHGNLPAVAGDEYSRRIVGFVLRFS